MLLDTYTNIVSFITSYQPVTVRTCPHSSRCSKGCRFGAIRVAKKARSYVVTPQHMSRHNRCCATSHVAYKSKKEASSYSSSITPLDLHSIRPSYSRTPPTSNMMVFGGRDPAQKVMRCRTRRNARLLSAVGVDLEQDLGLQMGAVDFIHKQPQKKK